VTSTFSHILQRAYQEIPEKTCLHLLHPKKGDQNITYRDLIAGSANYAASLKGAGVKPGDVVIQVLQHGEDLIFAFFGAIFHGAIPAILPFLTEKLSPNVYRRSLAALIEISKPVAVITYREFVPEVEKALSVDDSVRSVIVTDQVARVGEPNFDTFEGLERNPSDIVLLQHSSGTTGLQKGVALSHQAVINHLESMKMALSLSPDDVVVSWLPLYHDMGLIAGFIMPILCQIPLVLMSPFDWVRAPYKLMQAVSDFGGTLSWLPNFAYNFCAQKIRDRHLEGVDLSSWRAVTNCSEPIHWQSHQLFLDRFAPYGLKAGALATSYAMAENVFAVTQAWAGQPFTIDEVDARAFQNQRLARPSNDENENTLKLVSSGYPLDNVELRILDDAFQHLPDRHLGQIALKSDSLLTAYYHRPNVTKESFHDGWYLTGDIGYVAKGEVYVTGRRKELIIVGGKNVYPQDLERLAAEADGIHQGRLVAFGNFNQRTGTEEIVLIAESDVESEDQRRQIANHIRQLVTQGSDVALRYVQVVERKWLLKTSSGKIARGANRDKYLAQFHKTGA